MNHDNISILITDFLDMVREKKNLNIYLEIKKKNLNIKRFAYFMFRSDLFKDLKQAVSVMKTLNKNNVLGINS